MPAKSVVKLLAIAGAVMFLGVCALIVLGFLFLRSLGAHYEIAGGKVSWVAPLNHNIRRTRHEVPEADIKTFRAFSWSHCQWASDKNHVYFEGRVLRDADPDDFEIIDTVNDLSRSGNNEYKRSQKIKNDVEKFVSLGAYSCLLYTSPSPRDRQKSRMPSSA